MRSMTYRIRENGIALQDLTKNQGVILHDTPADYFTEYMASARNTLEKNASMNAFFKKVWESQREFAKTAVPFWSNAQRTNANIGRAYLKQKKK